MKRITTSSPKLLESHIQQAVVEYLQIDGWRAFRTELTVQRERGRVVGERGQPDYLFLRYCPHAWEWHRQEHQNEHPWHPGAETQADVLFLEFKRPGEKPRVDQFAWHEAERKRGAVVLVVDNIDEFQQWYEASGLRRRVTVRRVG